MQNSKILRLGLAFAIVSLTSIQISAMEPFERLSPQEQALERERQQQRPLSLAPAQQAQGQGLFAQIEAYAQAQEQARAQQEAYARVIQKYSDIQPILQPLQQGLQQVQQEIKQLQQQVQELQKAQKNEEIQPQNICCIEADGCTEDQGVGPIPCKNKHTDLICNSCLAKIKNTTNRCPICQEPLIG